MKASTISKTQSKKALAGNKQKKVTIKNVLVNPYNSYWPLVTDEHNKTLKDVLKQFLPRLKPEKVIIPYKTIKSVDKSERKAFRKQQNPIEFTPNKTETDYIILGVNGVSSSLEKRKLGAILIASDINPRIFIQHVVDQSVLYKVPILVMNELRTTLQEVCGVASSTLGLMANVNSSPKIKKIIETISLISKAYRVSKSHINYKRSLQLDEVVTISDCEMPKPVKVEQKEHKNWHLTRPNNKTRAFIPKTNNEPKSTEKSTMDMSVEFISFGPQEVAPQYETLKVRRIQGDKNRQTRKKNFKTKKFKK